jgi:hypothetical protein
MMVSEQHVGEPGPALPQRNREEQTGKREERVDDLADHVVQNAAEVSGERPEKRADRRRRRPP